MNILFITDNLFPDTNASSEIVYHLCEILHNVYHCNMFVMGYYSKGFGSSPDYVKTLPLNEVNQFNSFVSKYPNRSLRIKGALRHPSQLLYRLKNINKDYLAKVYYKEINKAHRLYHFNAIVAVSMPYHTVLSLRKLTDICPFYIYLLDPLLTHSQLQSRHKLLRILAEAEKKSAGLFVTDLIYSESYSCVSSSIRQKMTVLDFPNILIPPNIEDKDDSFSPDAVHIVFCGRFYPDIRTPDFLLSLFDRIKEQNIVLHIVGHNAQDSILPQNMTNGIVFHGRVSGEEARAYMQHADILVNVGNANANQLPSKILTYISYGKPILNLTKIDNCPSQKYLKDYTLGLTIPESQDISNELVKKVIDFCHEMKGKTISFESIQKQYESCTPEYVAKKMLDVILNHASNKGS